ESGPVPLRCAAAWIRAALATPGANATDAATQMPRANAVLLLAAALDGHGATEALARSAVLPPAPSPRPPACGADDLPSAAGAAWLSRVPWPVSIRSFETARHDVAPWSPPAPFVIVLLGIALLLFVRAALRPAPPPGPRQAMSSRLGYPGLVLLTGLGWLLLLELSANGHPGNRYLALYHQGHLWLGMLVLTTGAFLRQPLARATTWALSVTGETARAVRQRVGAWRALAVLALATLASLAVFGLALSNMRQLTSELGRIWLIVGAA